MSRSSDAAAADEEAPASDVEQVEETKVDENNTDEEEKEEEKAGGEEKKKEEEERVTVANASSARRALFAAVEGGTDGTEHVLSCRPIVELFFPKSKSKEEGAPTVIGDGDMTAKEQQKLLLASVGSHKFNKGYARRLFAGLTSILTSVVENEDYVPASAYDDDDDDGSNTATRATLNASMQQEGAAEIVPDEESTEALLFMRACSMLVESYLDGLVERRPDAVPAGKEFPIIDEAFTVAELLHDSLFSLLSCGPVAVKVEAAVSSLCERWWHGAFEGREQLVTMLVPLLVAKTLDASAQKSDVRRLFLIRGALDLLDFTDGSISFLRSLLLRTPSSPLYTKSVDGRRLIAHLFRLDPSLVGDLHRAIRVQVPDARRAVLDAYGEVYLRAWKGSEDDPDVRSAIEEHALQDLMFASLHIADRNMAKSIRTVLSPLHEAKKSPDVEKLLHRMYGPILWRALSAANALVRLNAASVLADTFPLRDPDESDDRTAACVAKTVAALTGLLRDPEPKVRVAGSDATGRILVMFWDALPTEDIRTLLNEIITKHASDASSSAVRAEAIATVSLLLEAEHSHAVLRPLLPSLGNLIHDRIERVRLAVVKMLQKIKKIRGFKYYHVVPVDHLLARLHAEGEILGNPTGSVASALTALMLNSYFPQGENVTGSDQIKRTLTLLTNNSEAASVFYGNVASHLSVNSVAKLAAMLLKCLSAAIEADVRAEAEAAERGENCGTGKKRRRSDPRHADGAGEDQDSVKTLNASDTTLMAAITETICCLWESIASSLADPDNEECNDFLVGAFSGAVLTDALSHFERKSKANANNKQRSECHRICAAILRCAGNLQPTDAEGLASHISSINASASTDLSAHIALLCVWGMQEDVAKSLARSIKSGFGEDTVEDGEDTSNRHETDRTKKRKQSSARGRKKSGEELPFPCMPSGVAVNVLSTLLRGSDPSCTSARESILGSVTACSAVEEALESVLAFAEKMLTATSAPDASKVAVTLAACEAYGRLALHKEARMESQPQFSSQAKTLLAWISNRVVPAILSKHQENVTPSPLGNLNLSRISVGSGGNSPAGPFSPIPTEPPRRRSNRNKTPNRFDSSFDLSTDNSISFDLDIPHLSNCISTAAIALVKSAVVVFSEWITVGGSGGDEVALNASKWAQVLRLESEEVNVKKLLVPVFCRLAVCLAKRCANCMLLKELLVACDKVEEGSIEEASVRKMLLSLLSSRGAHPIDRVLDTIVAVESNDDSNANNDLPESAKEADIAIAMSVILSHSSGSVGFAKRLGDNIRNENSSSNKVQKCVKLLWVLCEAAPKGSIVEIKGVIRGMDLSRFSEDNTIKGMVDKLVASLA